MPKVYVQKWIEDETGWGERPDGYSVHLNLEDIPKFIEQIDQAEAEYLDKLRKNDPGAMLNECSRPTGDPIEKEVDEAIYEQVKQTSFGLMVNEKWSAIEGS